MGWLNKLFNIESYAQNENNSPNYGKRAQEGGSSGMSARNRLKLVLMHDRTQLSPEMMEKMRDELVEVISKYVEIDSDALDINLESESNTIALVANIPVVRAKVVEDGIVKQVTPAPKKKAEEPETPVETATEETEETTEEETVTTG